ncbi:MAG: type 1 glutamine amidotransferase, partial [Geobacteraceae bacterium]|nr:type 1 glutamine amidotransferase [Geobacteraceae bacterium]
MVHILQNDPAVPAGNIVEFLPVPPRICRLYRGEPLPEPGDVSSLIVLGGSMGANDDRSHPFLTALKLYIRHIVTAGIPFLGICLGGQLLAEATGGRAVSGRWEELGTLPVMLTPAGREDRLFRGIPEKFVSFHWHHDSFDLPADGVLLATSEGCPHHAFRVGERAWGLQFHPEVTEGIVRD